MAYLNEHYLKLKAGYLFPEIARRVNAFCQANPDAAKRLIRCGIGDVAEPLPPAVIAALHKAVDEMGQRTDSTLRMMKSLCPTGPNVIAATSSTFSGRAIALQ
jgi:hypothetical protein